MPRYRNSSNAPIFLRGGIRVGPGCEVEVDERVAMSAGPVLVKIGTVGPQLLTEAPLAPLEVVPVEIPKAPEPTETVTETTTEVKVATTPKKSKKKPKKTQ